MIHPVKLDDMAHLKGMDLFEYAPRRASFLGAYPIKDHTLKVYSLVAQETARPAPTADKISQLLAPGLPDPESKADHKVGFGILHWGNDGLYALTNTWYDANMLRMKGFMVDEFSSDNPKMKPLADLNIIACVWELEIYKYERDLWINSVLAQKPAKLTKEVLRDYLNLGFEGYV